MTKTEFFLPKETRRKKKLTRAMFSLWKRHFGGKLIKCLGILEKDLTASRLENFLSSDTNSPGNGSVRKGKRAGEGVESNRRKKVQIPLSNS